MSASDMFRSTSSKSCLGRTVKCICQWLQYKPPEGIESCKRKNINYIVENLVDSACTYDLVARLLIKKCNLNWRGCFLFAIIAIAFLQGLGLLLYSVIPGLSPSELATNYIYKSSNIPINWFLIPVLFACLPWLTRGPGSLLAGLYRDEVVTGYRKNPPKHFIELYNYVRSWFSKWWLYPLFLPLPLWLQCKNTIQIWNEINVNNFLLYHILTVIIGVVLFYTIQCAAYRLVVTVFGLFKLFGIVGDGNGDKRIVDIQPLHPDRVGGLSRLSEYVIQLSRVLAVFGLWFTLQVIISVTEQGFKTSIKDDVHWWITLLIYIILSPLLFFLTLGSARSAMLEAKRKYLKTISVLIDTAYKNIIANDKAITKTKSPDLADKVRLLNKLSQMTFNFPVWPFDFATIRLFITAWILPIAAPLLVALIVSIVF